MRYNIAGPLCFSGDVVKRDVFLPMVNRLLTGIVICETHYCKMY